MAFVFVRSRPNGRILLHNGFLFRINKRTARQTYWLCTTPHCNAMISLDIEEKTILFDNSFKHCHAADPAEVEVRKFYDAVKLNILDDPNIPLSEIHRKTLSKLHLSSEILAKMPTFTKMKHFMCNVRASVRPPVSETSEKFPLDGIWRTTSDEKSFLRTDAGMGENQILVSFPRLSRPVIETNNKESNDVSTPTAVSDVEIATPIFSSTEKNSNQFADGYVLYAREVRNSVIAANPNKSFGDISHLIRTEWRQLPIQRKKDYEEQAHKRKEEPKHLRHECLWDKCHQQFEKLVDLINHLTRKSSGHIWQTFENRNSKELEIQCLWYNCRRTKKCLPPFPQVYRLIRHVKEVHLPWNPIKVLGKESFLENREKKETAIKPSQPNRTTSVAKTPPPTSTEEPPPTNTEEPPTITKEPPPTNTEEPLLNVIQIPKPVSVTRFEVQENPTPKVVQETPTLVVKPTVERDDYVFEGKRLVNMGYFIKSLQMLNDHNGRNCNFSDMKVCRETKDNSWNVGIVFKCMLCPTTKIIWMEDPSSEEAPSAPIIFKPQLQKPTIPPPPTQLHRLLIQPYQSLQKTPTTPSDNDTPPGDLPPFSRPPISMEIGELPYCSNAPLNGQNTTLFYSPQQTPSTEQLQVQPVIGPQVPAIALSQQFLNNQTQVPVFCQSQSPITSLTQLVTQLQDSVIDQSPTHAIVQSQVPLIDFPQVASIKQEFIFPDHTMTPSLISTLSEPTKVEMTFCVDQDESTTKSGSGPSDTYTAMDITENNNTTSDAFTHTRTSLPWPGDESSLPIAMDTTMSPGNTETLPVDLNLVKKEVDDETLCY